MPYWIVAVGNRGHPYLVGYKHTQAEADRYIYESLPGRGAEVHFFPTYDGVKVVRSLRHVRIPEVGLEQATRNFRHSREVV